MNKPIVILIGAARSGTKIVRDTLAQSSEVSAIPYDINFIWRYGNNNYPDDQLGSELLNERIKKYIQKKIQLLGKKSNNKGKFILEKTVANALRIDYINSIFPSIKYIHLVRNGWDVTDSASRQWKKKPEITYFLKKLKYFPISNISYTKWYITNLIKGIMKNQYGGETWGPRYKDIDIDLLNLSVEELCAKQWSKCIIMALNSLNKIAQDRIFFLRYEKFVTDKKYLENLCNFLEIDNREPIKFYDKKIKNMNSNESKIKLSNNLIVKNIIEETHGILEAKSFDSVEMKQ